MPQQSQMAGPQAPPPAPPLPPQGWWNNFLQSIGVNQQQPQPQQPAPAQQQSLAQQLSGQGINAFPTQFPNLGPVGGLSSNPLSELNFKDYIMGAQPQFIQAQRFTPGQYSALNDILGQLGGAYSEQPYNFRPIAAQAQQRFQEQTLPSIAERFAGMNATQSSGFGRAATQAGKDFESSLAALQSQHALQRMPYLNQLASLGLTEPYLSNLGAGSGGSLGSLLSGTGSVVGSGIKALKAFL